MTLTNSGTLSDTGTFDNAGTIVGTGKLIVDPASMTNSGYVGIEVTLSGAGSYFGNTSTGTLKVATTGVFGTGGAVSVVNAGTIDTTGSTGIAVDLTAGGYIHNSAGAHLLSSGQGAINIRSAAGTVINDGVLSGKDGIYFTAGGTVINGSVTTAASISANTSYGHGILVEGGAAAITNFGHVTGYYAVDIDEGGTVANTGASSQIAGHTGIAVGGTGTSTTTVTNDGTISGLLASVGPASGMLIRAAANVTNNATGTITGIDDGILIGGANTTITNLGKIVGHTGVYSSAFTTENVTVINSGTIASSNGGASLRFGAGINRLILDPGAAFVGTVYGNHRLELAGTSAGTVSGIGTQFQGFGYIQVDAGSQWKLTGSNSLASGVTMVNAGTLTLAGTLTDTGVFTNSGSLVGNGALIVDPTTFTNTGYLGITTTLVSSSELDNTATGTIVVAGTAVHGTGTPATVINAGTISGTGSGGVAVGLLGGGDVTNTGLISAGYVAVGIKGAGTAANYGTITGATGGGGFGVVVYSGAIFNGLGGATAALISAQSGVAAVIGYGTLANAGTISGTVGIVAQAATIANSGTVVGVVVGVGFDSVHTSTITNYGRIFGATGIGVAPGAGAATAAQTVINSGTIIGTSGTAIAFGSGNDRLKLVPSASVAIQGVVDGGAGTNTLEFASAASHGTLSGVGADFINFTHGTVDSGAYWVLAGTNTFASTTSLANSGTLVDAGTLTNAGTIHGAGVSAGLSIATGGVLTNAAGGYISGAVVGVTAASTATVDNLGIIQGTTFAAVRMASGVMTNGAAGTSGGTILGSGYGVRASGIATVINYGFITASNQDGIFLAAGGSLANYGTIGANEYGALLYGSGTATNHGTISAFGAGIITNDAADVVVNSGLIVGSSTTAGSGVILQAGGTVIDSGTIQGSDAAISFRGTVGDLLVLENGYRLNGVVSGSTLASSNMVELLGTSAADAVTATYNNLNLQNIGTVGFAAGNGNYATLRITNNATLPHTIANFIGIHDTVDLSALAYVAASSVAHLDTVSNRLMVTNGTSSVALQLGAGSYTGVSWRVANDDSGGTDVFVGVQPPPVTATLSSDTGASSTDKITSNPGLTGGGDANATVTISEGVTPLGTTTADGLGHWSFTPSGLADGSQTLVASETNLGGTGTASLTFTLDTTSPAVAISSSGGLTNQAAQTIAGTVSDANLAASPTISLFDNGNPVGTTTASGGAWSTSLTLSGDGRTASRRGPATSPATPGPAARTR